MTKDQTAFSVSNGGQRGGVYNAGPSFMGFVSSAVSSAHIGGVDLPGVQVQWQLWETTTPSPRTTSIYGSGWDSASFV